MNQLQAEVANMIVETLNLDIDSSSIDVDAALFGESGLGLDSIDALELACVITQKYGFQLRADDENNHKIFSSIANLCEHIENNSEK